ncbi:MAG: hypothetical protein LBS47_00205 [Endomicrobium sp.]|nr:hypothetical protein [Endomicrobium sp.]
MIAGAKYRGGFGDRFKVVLKEHSIVVRRVILFIDELHTVVGADLLKKDIALERRLDLFFIAEFTIKDAVLILGGIKKDMKCT